MVLRRYVCRHCRRPVCCRCVNLQQRHALGSGAKITWLFVSRMTAKEWSLREALTGQLTTAISSLRLPLGCTRMRTIGSSRKRKASARYEQAASLVCCLNHACVNELPLTYVLCGTQERKCWPNALTAFLTCNVYRCWS